MSHFSIATRIFFGEDSRTEFISYLKARKLKKLAFLIDQNLMANPHVNGLISYLQKNAFAITKVQPGNLYGEPTYDDLDIFMHHFRSLNIDALVAIGGGSILDLAKGIGILLRNPGKAIDYRGMDKVAKAGVPVICFPTTTGTGSEATHTASFIDSNSMTKLGINGKNVAPICGVLMPELTFSCPTAVTIYSGLDAMLHAVEAVTAKTSNMITAMIGSEAFALLYNNFTKVIKMPDDYTARAAMLLGSYYAGIAMMNAGGGPSSGISYPLGVHYKVSHGIAGGIFLPHVFEYNVLNGYEGYVGIYNRLHDADTSLSDKGKSIDFVKKMKGLYEAVKAPASLHSFGIKKSDINTITELTMEQRKGNLDLNPVPFGRDDVRAILEKVV